MKIEQKPALLIFVIFLLLTSSQQLIGQEVKQESILFETDKWKLTVQHEAALSYFFRGLENRDYQITVKGYTDYINDSLYNLNLSQKRANSVYEYLISSQIQKDKITIGHFGEGDPVGDNSTAAGRQANRRVDIKLEILPEPEPEIVVEKRIRSIQDLYKLIRPAPVTFCYNFKNDTVVEGEQGTLFYVRANSFDLDPDTLTECVQIHYKERYKPSEILRENLSTTSNGEILISQAMIHIAATYKGRPIELVKDITIFSPTDSIVEEMALFDGQRDAFENMDWNRVNSRIDFVSGSIFESCEYGIIDFRYMDCKLFFCKIKRFIGSIFSKKGTSGRFVVYNSLSSQGIPCDSILNLFDEFEKKYEGFSGSKMKDIPKNDLQYYVFNRRAGWSNLDWMAKIKSKVKLKVITEPAKNVDAKVVFSKQRSIVPLQAKAKYFHKKDMPRGYTGWIVSLKFEEDVPLLALKKTRMNGYDIKNLAFQAYSTEELIEKLKVLDP